MKLSMILVTRDQPRRYFNALYVNSINNLKSAKKFLSQEANSSQAVANNKWAILEISEIFIWENLVNTYGNVPYTDSFDPDKTLSPKYDDASQIYNDLLRRLDLATSKISVSNESYGASDLVYYGDMNKWRKLANSIKLRLALNLADVNPTLSRTVAEQAVKDGVISSYTDAYAFSFDSGTFTSPVYDIFVASGRNDFLPSSVVINIMNQKADPRRTTWFTTAPNGNYIGGNFGTRNSYKQFSLYSNKLTSPTASANLLSYSEILFLQAEAAARGYAVGNSAEQFYNLAITESMREAGINTSEAQAYLADHPYDAGNWKKSIGEEAYIALFDKGYAAWNFTRRLDFPVLQSPGGSELSSIPYRMPYSSWEYTRNGTNVRAAAAAIGGDKAETKLFWDIH